MSTIRIDANELAAAAPQVARLYATVLLAARELGSADVTCELPDGLAGRVISGISAAAHELDGAVRTLDGLDGELKRRARLAAIADAAGLVNFGLGTVALPTNITKAAAENPALRVPEAAKSFSTNVGRVLSVAGWAGTAASVAADGTNPFIDRNRKASDGIAKVALKVGVPAAATGVAVAVGAAALPAVAIGAGVGLAYSVADHELHITRHVSDAVNQQLDEISSAVHAAPQTLVMVGKGVQSAVDAGKGFVHDIGGLL